VTCSICGTENPIRARFCMECASPLPERCKSCGAELPAAAKFCVECAAPVGDAPPASASPSQGRAPRAYTPAHIADKILRNRTSVEGERKQVTVLFADIQGSMTLSEQLGEEEWHTLLDRFFQLLTDGVHRFEGTINQYTGDGVMALFGAPIAHEDHAHRACYAALHLLDELRAFADDLRLRRGISFSVRLGLNSGDVIVGTIGDDLRMDYTAQGHVVGLAARMQQLAAGDRAYLTQHTARLVKGFFDLRSLGDMEVRGAHDPVHVYELLGVGRLRTRFDLSRSRGLSRFVGRAAEMATLEAALERALAGRGQVFGVVASAGLGKSRLCYEFAERCRERGIAVHSAHCLAHARTLAFLPVRELLRDFFDIREGDDERQKRKQIAGELALLDESLTEYLPLIFDFMRVPDPERRVPDMDPGLRQARLFDAFGRLAQATTRARPAVFLFEDLHWVDESTDALIGAMVDQTTTTRSLLLLNFRPEYRAEWMSRPIYQQLALRPLDDRAAEDLVGELLGRDDTLKGLAARIRDRTAGNPFFIEELVRALVESGELIGTPGEYRLEVEQESVRIPASVHSLVSARIDRLEDNAKIALQSAAVLGKRVPAPLLQKVTQLPLGELARALQQLCDSEFLYPEAFYPTAEYAFVHPLTQEVAYGSALTDARERRHRIAAEVLAAGGDRGDTEHVLMLAHHREGAGQLVEAAECHAEAAERMLARYGSAAFKHFERALDLALQCVDSSHAREIGIRACARMLDWGGRLRMNQEDADRLLARGESLALAGTDDGRVVYIAASHSVFAVWQGVIDHALVPLERALALAGSVGAWEEQANARFHLALARYFGGRLEEAATGFQGLLDGLSEHLDLADSLRTHPRLSPLIGSGLTMLAKCHLDLGDLGAARRVIERILLPADRSHGPTALSQVLAAQGLLFVALGDAERALETSARAVELAAGSLLRTAPVESYRSLAAAHLFAGDLEGAGRAAEQALEIANQTDPGLVTGIACRIALSQVMTGLGEPERGIACAEQALGDCLARGYRLQLPEAHLARAHAILASVGSDGADAIRSDLAAVRAQIEEMGRRILVPELEALTAAAERVFGDEARARAAALAAVRQWRELGSPRRARSVAAEWSVPGD
jgi:class 3 adenylate cyclase/tetratricopeptide (TPR) repeat protein